MRLRTDSEWSLRTEGGLRRDGLDQYTGSSPTSLCVLVGGGVPRGFPQIRD